MKDPDVDPDVDFEKVPAMPDEDGIVSIRHRLRTEDLTVRCYTADGSPVGFLWATPISADEIEVVTVPSSGVSEIEVYRSSAGQGI